MKTQHFSKKIAGLAAILLFVTLPRAHAQAVSTKGALTLPQAIENALSHDSTLQSAALKLTQETRAKSFGWNTFLPTIADSSVSLSNTHTLLGEAASSDSDWRLSATYLDVSAKITFSADLPLRFKTLDYNMRAALDAWASAKRDLEVKAAGQFYTLLAAKLNIGILRADSERQRALYEQVQARYSRGLASELEVLRSQLSYQKAQASLERASASYKQSLASFLLLTGFDANADVDIEGSIDVRGFTLPEASALAAEYASAHDLVRSAALAVESARLAASSASNKALPSLSR